jgi:hypothetical protein
MKYKGEFSASLQILNEAFVCLIPGGVKSTGKQDFVAGM